MKLHVLCFLLLLCMYSSLAQGHYESCCLRYGNEPKIRIKRKVVSYRLQETDGGCNIPAVIFTFALKKNVTFCANPNEHWVQKLMKRTKSK
ncbi:C-C motif chemokine 25b [Neoarius graeffei]|uniref:C-C motif chemokine 25b n=1 Tax=Neoarius graeffei TaxID=443677 RepID=UPI00298CD159|nr:C-C motif chemokine 25b [Neoarius graeffei]